MRGPEGGKTGSTLHFAHLASEMFCGRRAAVSLSGDWSARIGILLHNNSVTHCKQGKESSDPLGLLPASLDGDK